MTDKRKYLRVVIPADLNQAFTDAKQVAENEAMIKLSDTQYASRLIQWALSRQGSEKGAAK